MVNNRLMWVLESKGLLASEQCGFRKNRSTADHLVRFDSYIRNAFAKKEHVLAIFFDLEKAYDTMWKHGILSDLYDLDFRGHMPTFIDGFLSHRLFQVRAGSTKPGKDSSDPNNYRPIALTSCLCETMERMVNNRLMWVLESKGSLASEQCGFRKNRSTADHVVRFDSYIRNAFAKKEHVLVIFFDLEKSYDTTWKHGILSDLYDCDF